VLLIEDFGLPAAVRGAVGAKIIEEAIATQDASIVEQHHAGVSSFDTIQRPDVNRIKPVDDAALTDFSGRADLLLQRRHD
jgi:hypothetical protein